MRKRRRQPHGPTRRAAPRGGGREGGGFYTQKRPRVRQRGARRLVEFSANYNTPHQYHMGGMEVEMQPEAGGGGGGVGLSVDHGCFVFSLCFLLFPLSGGTGMQEIRDTPL